MMQLIIHSISSDYFDLKSWIPSNLDEVFVNLVIEIGCNLEEGVNLFYVDMASPEGLRKAKGNMDILALNRTILISNYSYEIMYDAICKVVESCTDKNWSLSCSKLQRYFDWEYEDYELE
ncbi:hypothetical protein EXE30_06630 [Acinetobacter halotolerans]|uniref:Uncharacterized protein n=1 Tax=Acinetobacter halotolerans TaxID=1752076 RepID=A0A4Q6XA19_9GAMM|nr:Imm8 family immunity protein [Acinetobacter halotolerans]RZF53645.1 hypothetical protein EXE30_06630 [Acinetobacter halotolerans]